MAIPAFASKGLGMLKQFGSALKRSPESRACIDRKKASGLSGKQARTECRSQYGSRFGNAGRSLGILPEELKGLSINQVIQKESLRNSPARYGTVGETFGLGQGGGFGGTTNMQAKKGGFNLLFLLPLLLFVPQIQKLVK